MRDRMTSRSSSQQGPRSRGSSRPASRKEGTGHFGGKLGLSASQVGALRRDYLTQAGQPQQRTHNSFGRDFAPEESAITQILDDPLILEDEDDDMFTELDMVSKINPNPIHRLLSPSGQKQLMRRQQNSYGG